MTMMTVMMIMVMEMIVMMMMMMTSCKFKGGSRSLMSTPLQFEMSCRELSLLLSFA